MSKDDEISIDFGKMPDWFQRKKKGDEQPVPDKEASSPVPESEETPQSSEKKDDEITIDFKKMLGWFSRDQKHEHHAHPPASVEKEDDIKIDFTSMINWFRKPVSKSHDATKEDELGFDLGKVLTWIRNHPVLVVLVLLLLFQFVPARTVIAGKEFFLPWGGMWMRLQGEQLPVAQGFAQNHVHTTLRNQLSNAIGQQYPNLPDERKNKLIEEEWQKLYKQQSPQIDQQVQLVAQQIKSFWQYEADGRTYTYMPDIDPYQWLRYARNYFEKGHVGDELKNGVPWDTHMLAPLGTVAVDEFHPPALAWLHWFMKLLNPSIPFMQSATYFPIVFLLFAMIPAFFIGRRFGGLLAGIATATMIAIMPAIMSRTTWGHADTDPYNIFFPLLCTWLFFEALEARSLKNRILLTGGLGFSFGVYVWAWPSGWWYIFDFMLITLGVLIAFELFQNRRHLKNSIPRLKELFLVLGLLLVSTGIFVTLFRNFVDFWYAPIQPLHFVVIKAAAHPTLWPNVYTTVAELNPTNIVGAIQSIGGRFVMGLAIIGILLLLLKKADGWKLNLRQGVFFAIWILAALYASTKGVRFTLLLAPVVAVCFGIALGKISTFLVRVGSKDLKLNPKLMHVTIILLIAFLLAGQARSSYGISRQDVPIMNDAWWNALNAIKDDSRPNAIINSWWDFGHHFKYVADRAVTFDGASQNTPMAHWIGRVLSTSNELEAVGILRMLDCGSNTAFEVLNKQFDDPVRSVKLLYRIVTLDRKAAHAILAREGVHEQEEVLRNTHCDPPEDYFIASDDMIGKSGVWGHFGNWNFERAKLWIVLRHQDEETAVQSMMNEWNYTREQAEQAYADVQAVTSEDQANAWISPWPGILGGTSGCTQTGALVACGNGLQHNLSNGETVIRTAQGVGRPPLLAKLLENGKLEEIRFNDSSIGIAALLYPTGLNSYESLLASPELITSTFVKLYFLDGHGLKHFKEFNRQQLITGGQIITYKVDWAGNASHAFSGIGAVATQRVEAKKVQHAAHENDTVLVHYTGALLNDELFDSSIKDWKKKNITMDSPFEDYDHQPFTFTIGSGQAIPGFDAAVRGMTIGEEKTVQIPPPAAYGLDPQKHLLGNQTLQFKIRLVLIE